MNLFTELLHKVSHITKTNHGRVVSWHNKDICYVGFMCTKCGQIDKKTIEQVKLEKETKNE